MPKPAASITESPGGMPPRNFTDWELNRAAVDLSHIAHYEHDDPSDHQATRYAVDWCLELGIRTPDDDELHDWSQLAPADVLELVFQVRRRVVAARPDQIARQHLLQRMTEREQEARNTLSPPPAA